jgi:hypothetical protein
VKRANTIAIIIVIAVAVGGGFWWHELHAAAAPPADEKSSAAEKPADAEKPAEGEKPAEAAEESHVSHDEQGNTVVSMSDDDQGDAGIVFGNPAAGQWSQEVKGYGRVLDPAPLAGLLNELVLAQAATNATAREWERQKTLSAQNNTSARALQAAEAAALHDQLAVQSVRDRLALAWGATLAGRDDLAGFVQSLAARQSVLVRVDLPGGEALAAPPAGARVVTLSGQTTQAKFLSPTADVDPQIQGQGFLFSIQPNTNALAPGQAVTVWLQIAGDPLTGVIVPPNAVVRVEGSGWVYVMNKGGESFTRRKIALDRPTDAGWFVTGTLKADDYIVVTGAQTLLSEELKAALSPD